VLEHVIAEGDLPIGSHDYVAIPAHANHGGRTDAGVLFGERTLVQKHGKTSGIATSGRPEINQDAETSIGHLPQRTLIWVLSEMCVDSTLILRG
jgi:hypothetical protein